MGSQGRIVQSFSKRSPCRPLLMQRASGRESNPHTHMRACKPIAAHRLGHGSAAEFHYGPCGDEWAAKGKGRQNFSWPPVAFEASPRGFEPLLPVQRASLQPAKSTASNPLPDLCGQRRQCSAPILLHNLLHPPPPCEQLFSGVTDEHIQSLCPALRRIRDRLDCPPTFAPFAPGGTYTPRG